MDSGLLEEDKDDWIFASMNKYKNLSMFELEWPPDVMEVMGGGSLIVSGLQQFSKKCEILELALPPKILLEEDEEGEEGLVKDRDFQITSGGYAAGRITQIVPLPGLKGSEGRQVVATRQLDQNGVVLYQLGNEECAVIKEMTTLSTVSPTGILAAGPTNPHSLFQECSYGIQEWDLSSKSAVSVTVHPFPKCMNVKPSLKIIKIKIPESSPSVLYIMSDLGTVYLYDLRASEKETVPLFKSSKALHESTDVDQEDKPLFGFDIIQNRLGIVDSFGGYEPFDLRKPEAALGRFPLLHFPPEEETSTSNTAAPSTSSTTSTSTSSLLLPLPGPMIREKFGIEYSAARVSFSSPEFLLCGLKEESVFVFREAQDSSPSVLFTHSGHQRTVTSAKFHPSKPHLVFSASVDSLLHAWEYHEKEN